MGTCKYCEKSIPLANLKSHYKEHSRCPKTPEDLVAVTSKADSKVQTSLNNEDMAASKEDKNVQENCISSSSSPSDQMISSDSQENTEDMSFQKNVTKNSDTALEESEVSGDNNIDGEPNYVASDKAEKSVASSSESQSKAVNNLTMVIVKRELLDLDSDVLNIKKEVDPLADDLVISDQLEEGSTKVIIDKSCER